MKLSVNFENFQIHFWVLAVQSLDSVNLILS